ncbi:MAG: complex I NDUFA9 subunit family protein [Gammaproteobacteria bacterium]|nr:complex I NDUFA9 subunit family protein [Gammaproteobacteria bacterium]
MIIKKICMLGGSGFVGHTLANRLTRDGYQLRVLCRNREAHKDNLILLPDLELVEANVHDPLQLTQQFAGCDAVINLIGILNETGRSGTGFHSVHVALTEKVIEACRANGIQRLLHMSALNADAINGPSHYLRSKGKAEDKVHAAGDIHVTSFRPSVIFGANDSFFNRFASLLKLTPMIFPLACSQARFAPVFVEDVAEAIARTLKDPDSYGQRYELCGPHSYSLQELVEYTGKCAGTKRKIIALPDIISRIQATLFDLMGFVFNMLDMEKPFSTDNYLSTKVDSVCQQNSLIQLGIEPMALECIVPQYLSKRSQREQNNHFRV